MNSSSTFHQIHCDGEYLLHQKHFILFQEKGFLLTDVKVVFDEACKTYRIMSKCISADANVFTQEPFGKDILKKIHGRERELDDDERKCEQSLKFEVKVRHQKNCAHFQHVIFIKNSD